MIPKTPDCVMHVQHFEKGEDGRDGGSDGAEDSFEKNLNEMVRTYASLSTTIHRKGGAMCISGWMSGMGAAGKFTSFLIGSLQVTFISEETVGEEVGGDGRGRCKRRR